jgi:hypothetical protein
MTGTVVVTSLGGRRSVIAAPFVVQAIEHRGVRVNNRALMASFCARPGCRFSVDRVSRPATPQDVGLGVLDVSAHGACPAVAPLSAKR